MSDNGSRMESLEVATPSAQFHFGNRRRRDESPGFASSRNPRHILAVLKLRLGA
jgi:hypothetical protein